MKPDNLSEVHINTTKINDYAIKKLEIDLIHINYGLNKKKELNTKPRSNFTVQDVVSIFESLDGVVFEPERDEEYEYFIIDRVFTIHKKKLKLVFCIEIITPDTAGVITLYVMKKEIKS